MIKSISIKNFKSIRSKHFPLANLNVLLGLNGQGKSSFIQSLLLLRQSNIIPSQVKGWLNLRGMYVDIGTTRDAFYQYLKDRELAFVLELESDQKLSFQYRYAIDKDALPPVPEEGRTRSFDQAIEDAQTQTGLFTNQFQYLNAYRIRPRRDYPKNHAETVQKRNLGVDGRYSAHFIETFHDEKVVFENILHPKSFIKDHTTQQVFVNKTLIHQINAWMGEISPGIGIRTKSINSDQVLLEYEFKQPNYGTTNTFKPENVGFGITYALPVVTALLAAKPGALLIIENPESHLHPRGQAELGKLIALVAQNDVQIVVETHSDHLLNGIRVAVKEFHNGETAKGVQKDHVMLFYFEKKVEEEEQYSDITNIQLDANGTLSNEPKGLLDEWGNQLMKLL